MGRKAEKKIESGGGRQKGRRKDGARKKRKKKSGVRSTFSEKHRCWFCESEVFRVFLRGRTGKRGLPLVRSLLYAT